MRLVAATLVLLVWGPDVVWSQDACRIAVEGAPTPLQGEVGRRLAPLRVRVPGGGDNTVVRATLAGGAGIRLLNDIARTSRDVASFDSLVAEPGVRDTSQRVTATVRFVASGCDPSDPVTYTLLVPQPTEFILVRSHAEGARNQRLALPPVVEVRDQWQRPLSGVRVTLTDAAVPIGGFSAVTDGEGLATFTNLVVGGSASTPGSPEPVQLTVRVPGISATGTVSLSIREPIADLVVDAPDSAVIGQPLSPPLRVSVTGSGAAPIPGVPVSVYVVSGPGTLDSNQATTTTAGQATFSSLTVHGQPGPYQLAVVAGNLSREIAVHTRVGRPTRLLVVQQPPTRTLPDTAFDPPVVIAAEDADGNPVVGVDVVLGICSDAVDAVPRVAETGVQCGQTGPRGLLRGPLTARTDANGRARFDSLGMTGKEGIYYLWFCLRGSGDCRAGNPTLAESAPVRYDPRDLDRSYVVISAIKSIAGEIPSTEFFDLRFRFRLPWNFFLTAFVDLALTNRATDSVRSEQKALTEGSALLSWTALRWAREDTDFPHRTVYIGLTSRIFNTIPFIGVHLGSLELAGSPFHGSSGVVSVVVPFYENSQVIDGETIRPDWSLLMDFFIRSPVIDFFKILNVRGAVLIPFRGGERVLSRITIAVPLGDLVDFF